MAYNFVNGQGGYTFDGLTKEIEKFDRYDAISNFYNATYIRARQSIDWIDFGANIKEKIQFLVDWKTTIVRANQEEYTKKLEELANHQSFVKSIEKYQTIELPYIELSKSQTIADVSYIYSEAHFTLRPTTASKILHMFNPNLFPIWDTFMRKNLFRTSGHNPSQYVSWMLLMQKELGIIIKDAESTFHLPTHDVLGMIKNLDHPTRSLLRIMDKVNYINSRTPLNIHNFNNNVNDQVTKQMNGGRTMAITLSGGRIDTGLKLSDFVKNHLSQIDGFSMNKPGGYTFEEEKQLWRQGKMTASFLKQVAALLQYPTFQVSNYDLLHTLKSNRQKIIELLKNKPELDSTIRIKSKGQKPTSASGLLKSPLFDD